MREGGENLLRPGPSLAIKLEDLGIVPLTHQKEDIAQTFRTADGKNSRPFKVFQLRARHCLRVSGISLFRTHDLKIPKGPPKAILVES